MINPVKLVWQCFKCDDIVTSYSNIRHNMDFCKCGCSGVDLEEYYTRSFGSVVDVSRKELINGVWVDIK